MGDFILKHILVLAAVLSIIAGTAEARPRQTRAPVAPPECNVIMPCDFGMSIFAPSKAVEKIDKRNKNAKTDAFFSNPLQRITVISATAASTVVGGRPAGCPHAFCGCGASLYLFGRIIPSLNLAANWLRFPRAAPAPRMVAARRGHVFVLEQHIAGSTWLVHDSNSGRGRTRMHARSIAGFVIVDPHGAG